MNEQLKKTIEEEIKKIPKEVQDVINSIDWINISEEIGKKNFLDEKEITDIQTEIAFILIGAEHINYLAINIEHKTNLSKDSSEKIALEILQKICQPVAEKLTNYIKESIEEKKPTWNQNIDFIVSGGDYFAFLRQNRKENNLQNTPVHENIPTNNSKLEDLKNNFTI